MRLLTVRIFARFELPLPKVEDRVSFFAMLNQRLIIWQNFMFQSSCFLKKYFFYYYSLHQIANVFIELIPLLTWNQFNPYTTESVVVWNFLFTTFCLVMFCLSDFDVYKTVRENFLAAHVYKQCFSLEWGNHTTFFCISDICPSECVSDLLPGWECTPGRSGV